MDYSMEARVSGAMPAGNKRLIVCSMQQLLLLTKSGNPDSPPKPSGEPPVYRPKGHTLTGQRIDPRRAP